jgi:hypothetical protein
MKQISEIQDVFPLMPLQEGMYFHYLLNPESSTFFEQMVYELAGDLNVPAVEATINMLAERHEALRSNFNKDKSGRGVQIIFKKRQVPFNFYDFSEIVESGIDQKLADLLSNDRARKFSLEKDALLRVSLIRKRPDLYVLVWTRHHIIFDGWSTAILMDEYSQIYSALFSGKQLSLPAPGSLKDYFLWMQSRNAELSQVYWKKYLDGYTKGIGLPELPASEGDSPIGVLRTITCSASETQRLRNICNRENCSLYNLVSTTWGLAMGYFQNTRDIVFGQVVSGRPPSVTGDDKIVGLFINTLPLRITFDTNDGFLKILRRQAQQWLEGLDHCYVSLADVQQLSSAKHELIDHTLIFEDNGTTNSSGENKTGICNRVVGFRGIKL